MESVIFVNIMQHHYTIMTFDKVNTTMYQPSRSDNYRGQRRGWLLLLGL